MRFPLPSAEPSTTERWTSLAFEAELNGWCSSVLGTKVRLVNLKQRPWSTVWQVHAGSELFYAKQNCDLQNFEAELVSRLATLVPERVVPVAAIDEDRGFLLTPDQGDVIGEADEETWCRVVANWAGLQRSVIGQLHDLGLTTFEASEAADFLAARVDQLAALPKHDPRVLSAEAAARVTAHLPVVRRWAEEVDALGLPLTLNHNDLHGYNVFAADWRFFDFGDAVIAEPLAALLIPLRSVESQRITDAFIEVWSDVADAADLRRAVPAALGLACLHRHESWIRTMSPMNEAELKEYGEAAPRWLELVLDPMA